MNPRLREMLDRLREIELTPRQRLLATYVGYPLFALFVALLAFSWSVPRERVKDRLETALSADVMSGQPLAIGMDVNIGDLALKLFTGVGFQAPPTWCCARGRSCRERSRHATSSTTCACGSGCSRCCSGGRATRSSGMRFQGTVEGQVAGNQDETKVEVEVEKLVLNGVPGIQQSFAGLPVEASVSGKLDVSVPKNLLANANGIIEVDIEDLAIGDGKAKLTVPNDPFLAAGVTFPRIKLGKLTGLIAIEKGRARFEAVRVHSADADAMLDGYVELHDPIGTSQVHVYLKFRPSEALIKREPTVELLNNALSGTAKRSDGFLGIQITGPLAAMFFQPSKEPPFGVTMRNEPGGPATTTPPPPATPRSTTTLPPRPEPPTGTGTPSAGGMTGTPSAGGTTGTPSAGGTTGTPSAGGTTGMPSAGGTTSTPTAANPPPGGTEVAAPPPAGTTALPPATGTTIAPPPSLRSLRAEPLDPQPARNE